MRRRRFLSGFGLGVVGLGGCLTAPEAPQRTETGTRSPTPTAEGPCPDFEPHPVDLDTYGFDGYGNGLELTASHGMVPLGNDFSVRLRNTTDEPVTTGNETLYAVQRWTGEEWEHVLSAPKQWAWTEEALVHQPDEGFRWRFATSREGLGNDPYRVCAPVDPGTYRFVYWGLPDRRALSVTITLGLAVEPVVVEDYRTIVFDHAGIDGSIIDGGVEYGHGHRVSRHFVTVLESPARVDMDLLAEVAPDASTFVDETDFSSQAVVVFQSYPESSAPDYRVEEIVRVTNDVHLVVTDESDGGTADVTVETLFVRIPHAGTPPRFATVRTDEGTTYSTVG